MPKSIPSWCAALDDAHDNNFDSEGEEAAANEHMEKHHELGYRGDSGSWRGGELEFECIWCQDEVEMGKREPA